METIDYIYLKDPHGSVFSSSAFTKNKTKKQQKKKNLKKQNQILILNLDINRRQIQLMVNIFSCFLSVIKEGFKQTNSQIIRGDVMYFGWFHDLFMNGFMFLEPLS